MKFNFENKYYLEKYSDNLSFLEWLYYADPVYTKKYELPESIKENKDSLFYHEFHSFYEYCECFYFEDDTLRSFFTSYIIVKLLTDIKKQKNFKQLHYLDDERFKSMIRKSIFSEPKYVSDGEVFKYASISTHTTISFGI
jgi:hypothetical protein